ATFGDHKIGSHFRLYAGRLDNYDWNGTSYDIDPKKIHNYTVRLYGIYNWYKREKFRFNTTVLTRYTHVDSIGVSMENPDLRLATEKSRTFVFQINPNVNIFPWKHPMSFIDAAILCNYQHMRYDFLRPDGGFAGTGCPDTVWNPDDFSSQDFSYGRENFFELALDIFASIPVFGMRDQSAAIVISTLIWRRYLWMSKYYGSMRNDRFDAACKRKNFDKEMWLNAVVNFVYRYRSHMFRLDIGQPLIYSLTPRTTIYDASGNVKAGKSTENMWLSQSSFKIGFFYSTDLTNFIRYQPFKRPTPY
ncbi:MAG: hypothetical protein JW913_04995, partial [Chitinispirillaceae bacterium]|nr:hypothetical protein [Chitinispirillaceae bacterium]